MNNVDQILEDACTMQDCDKRIKNKAKGLCSMHYARLLKHGDTNIVLFEKHGKQGSSIYTCWQNMKTRCSNSNNPSYKYYGGRGIKVCDRWQNSFNSFYADMGEPTTPLHTLDRIDVYGNYEPSNCRWATRTEQSRNVRVYDKSISGHKGVNWDNYHKNWRAFVSINNKMLSVGVFKTREEAIAARIEAERKYYV